MHAMDLRIPMSQQWMSVSWKFMRCVRVGTFDGVGVHRAVMAPIRAFDDYVRATNSVASASAAAARS